MVNSFEIVFRLINLRLSEKSKMHNGTVSVKTGIGAVGVFEKKHPAEICLKQSSYPHNAVSFASPLPAERAELLHYQYLCAINDQCMAKKKTINVEGLEITILVGDQSDYISLTDIAASNSTEEPRFTIRSWMRNNNTLAYLYEWESVHNPGFKRGEAATFRLNATNNSFSASVQAWVDATNAIGLQSRSGRYGGGTFAHKEIAINFCYWFNPTFQVYLIKEFDRLKAQEAQSLNLEWNVKRIMSKANYRIHTEAVRSHLIPPKVKHTKKEGLYFASEADLINMALFGMTAKQWRESNPNLQGNIRDHATTEQLLVLSNLQSLNASLLEWGSDEAQRLELLNKAAIDQMTILVNSKSLNPLKPDNLLKQASNEG